MGEYAKTLKGVRASYSFAGSDALAAQIEQGVKPDVFASANTKLPDGLYARDSSRSRSCSRQQARDRGPSGSGIAGIADLGRKA